MHDGGVVESVDASAESLSAVFATAIGVVIAAWGAENGFLDKRAPRGVPEEGRGGLTLNT